MTRILYGALLAVGLGAPALAQDMPDLTATGDAEAGESVFRQCISCHVVVDDEGETLAGRNARTGPNLYGVVGRLAGAVEEYRYSDLMETAGEMGMVYDEANFVGYVMDPTEHLREVTGESGRSKMAYKVRSEDDAKNLYAYLAAIGPEMDEAATN